MDGLRVDSPLDALGSAVRLKIDFDVTLTEVASGLYRMLGRRLAGYESAHSRQLFRHFLNTPAEVEIADNRVESVEVRYLPQSDTNRGPAPRTTRECCANCAHLCGKSVRKCAPRLSSRAMAHSAISFTTWCTLRSS